MGEAQRRRAGHDEVVNRLRPPRARVALYLVLGLVFGVLWFTVVVGLWIGGLFGQLLLLAFPSIVVAQLLLRPVGRFERYWVRSLLGQEVPAPEPLRFSQGSGAINAIRRCFAVFQDGHSWRVMAWVGARVVLGPLGFAIVVLPVALLLAPLALVAGVASTARIWLLLAPLGLVLSPLLWRAANAVAGLHRRLAVWALGPDRSQIVAAALARAAQAEEQVRIDQELHDSIGHMLSMIVVQAGAGAHVFDADPAFARRALGTIEVRGRAALGELDRIISSISGGLQTGPLPEGQNLAGLIDGAREAGMNVVSRLHMTDLPPALGRGVFRIVQEALTNAAKHAPGAAVRADVAASQTAVAISVVNGHGGGPAVPGRGLASIRDRAVLLGGQATIGLTDDGDFAVNAVLPIAAAFPEGTELVCALSRRCACIGCTTRRSVLG